ncbi:hypothetical protein CFR79_03815 [Komagataeibacter saccharivorans]|nr:hypothetical protein CFR79_03815 [Komagataeibacter saccharivorans]
MADSIHADFAGPDRPVNTEETGDNTDRFFGSSFNVAAHIPALTSGHKAPFRKVVSAAGFEPTAPGFIPLRLSPPP